MAGSTTSALPAKGKVPSSSSLAMPTSGGHMTLSVLDLKRLVRRHPVIGHPMTRILMKTERTRRPWRLAGEGYHWLTKAWPEYRELLVARSSPELAALLGGLEPVGPSVSLETDPTEPHEEVE